ncbi:radical SAM protein [Fusobacterium ulcerans]|uniref:radical SAM protein n=1 Tax=Fusobacterium ulcerans TaxID=861 RepID=UPI0026E9878A|nr:radical SAM protein [Fusobacterium ulcerans]
MVTDIDIILTKKCNLRCSYCNDTHEDISMSLDQIEEVCNYIDGKDKNLTVVLIGGEITTVPELLHIFLENMKPRMKYINTLYIYTNGYIFNQEIYDFAKLYKNTRITLSFDELIDGVERPIPLDIAKRHIAKYAEIETTIIATTISSLNIDKLIPTIDILSELGIKNIKYKFERYYSAELGTNLSEKRIQVLEKIKRILDYATSKNIIPYSSASFIPYYSSNNTITKNSDYVCNQRFKLEKNWNHPFMRKGVFNELPESYKNMIKDFYGSDSNVV